MMVICNNNEIYISFLEMLLLYFYGDLVDIFKYAYGILITLVKKE